MKSALLLSIAAFSLVASLPASDQVDTAVYGRKLHDFSESYIESFLPSTPAPKMYEKPSEEWEYFMRLDGLASFELFPVWSPDGEWIACWGGRGRLVSLQLDLWTGPVSLWTGTSLWLIPVHGGDPVLLYKNYYVTEGGRYIGMGPSSVGGFSPDGEKIIFTNGVFDAARGSQDLLEFNEVGGANGRFNYETDLMEYTIATGEVETLEIDVEYGCYSYSGRYIAFTKFLSLEIYSLSVRDMESGEERILATVNFPWNFCFSPDDRYIIFEKEGQLYRISVDGGTPEQITFYDGEEMTTRHKRPTYSPDGEWILFSGNGGLRSDSYNDSNTSSGYSISDVEKICAYNTISGETVEFLPRPPAIESYMGKCSPDGKEFCYVLNDLNLKPDRREISGIYIKEFDLQLRGLLPQHVENHAPFTFALLGNYPNPFNPSTTIEFSLPGDGFAEIVIYNVIGQKVRELVAGTMTQGVHSAVWDGRDDRGQAVSAGVYVAKLRMNDNSAMARMIMVK